MIDLPQTTSMAAQIEQSVRDVFEKRHIGQLMPYQEARSLVWLEREIVSELVHRFCPEDRMLERIAP
jgi:hypothetical protein